MSCITDSKTLDDVFQPSLIYPSLTSYPKTNGRYPHNKTDTQGCIHFASRLIKLRSELMSSSYMSSSTSLQLLKSSPSASSISSFSSSSCSSSIIDAENIAPGLAKDQNRTGRIHSLPDVSQYDDGNIDSTSFIDDREDESEIMDRILSMNNKRETSQLTYLEDIIRQSMRQRQNFYSQSDQFYLVLPPKRLLHHQRISNSTSESSLTSKNQNLLQKSASLRDILLGSSQAKPPSIGNKYHHQDKWSSFPLASQLESASTAHPQGRAERNEKKKQKETDFSGSCYETKARRIREKSSSSLSHDSDDDESDTESEVILRHAVPATAFLVSLSPSAAAAASAARFRRRRPVLHAKNKKVIC